MTGYSDNLRLKPANESHQSEERNDQENRTSTVVDDESLEVASPYQIQESVAAEEAVIGCEKGTVEPDTSTQEEYRESEDDGNHTVAGQQEHAIYLQQGDAPAMT